MSDSRDRLPERDAFYGRADVRLTVEAAMNVARKTAKEAEQAQRDTLYRGGDVYATERIAHEAFIAQSMSEQAHRALGIDDEYALGLAEEALREALEVRNALACLIATPQQVSPMPPVRTPYEGYGNRGFDSSSRGFDVAYSGQRDPYRVAPTYNSPEPYRAYPPREVFDRRDARDIYDNRGAYEGRALRDPFISRECYAEHESYQQQEEQNTSAPRDTYQPRREPEPYAQSQHLEEQTYRQPEAARPAEPAYAPTPVAQAEPQPVASESASVTATSEESQSLSLAPAQIEGWLQEKIELMVAQALGAQSAPVPDPAQPAAQRTDEAVMADTIAAAVQSAMAAYMPPSTPQTVAPQPEIEPERSVLERAVPQAPSTPQRESFGAHAAVTEPAAHPAVEFVGAHAAPVTQTEPATSPAYSAVSAHEQETLISPAVGEPVNTVMRPIPGVGDAASSSLEGAGLHAANSVVASVPDASVREAVSRAAAASVEEGSHKEERPDSMFSKLHRKKKFTIPIGPTSEGVFSDVEENLLFDEGAAKGGALSAGARANTRGTEGVTVAMLIGHSLDISETMSRTRGTADAPVDATPLRVLSAESGVSDAGRGRHVAARRVDVSAAYDVAQNNSAPGHAKISVPSPVVSAETLPTPAPNAQPGTSASGVPASSATSLARTPARNTTVNASPKQRQKVEKKVAKMVLDNKILAEEAPALVEKLLSDNPKAEMVDATKPKKPRAIRWVCITLGGVCALLFALLVAAYLGLISLPWGLQERVDMLPDINAKTGTLNVQPANVAPGDYRLVLNQTPSVSAGSRECSIQFENPEGNEFNSRLVLLLDDTSEEIASTHRLMPGTYVESVALSRTLDPGVHNATAVVSVLAGTTQINSMSASVKITVK